MAHSDRPTVIAGNWKMYKTVAESVAYVIELVPLVAQATSKIYLAVPFTSIKSVVDQAKSSNLIIGAQNMHDASEGAFTGEIAAKMLVEAGARFVILGHSERRRLFNESNAFINRKVKRAVSDGLQPILCIGETQEERESEKTDEILKTQLTECLADLSAEQLKDLIIAYEPVWAIGTDNTATPEIAQKVHQFIRQSLTEILGQPAADHTVILYGGSAKPDNAKALLEEPDIDGLLVGGASLSAETFSKIVNIGTET
jgi:triosephosphate isomerase (TIM)